VVETGYQGREAILRSDIEIPAIHVLHVCDSSGVVHQLEHCELAKRVAMAIHDLGFGSALREVEQPFVTGKKGSFPCHDSLRVQCNSRDDASSRMLDGNRR